MHTYICMSYIHTYIIQTIQSIPYIHVIQAIHTYKSYIHVIRTGYTDIQTIHTGYTYIQVIHTCHTYRL